MFIFLDNRLAFRSMDIVVLSMIFAQSVISTEITELTTYKEEYSLDLPTTFQVSVLKNVHDFVMTFLYFSLISVNDT